MAVRPEKGPPKAPEASHTSHFTPKVGRAAKTSLQSTADGSGRTQDLIVAAACFHAAALSRCLLRPRPKDDPVLPVTRFRLQPVAPTEAWTQDKPTSVVVEDLMTVYSKLFSTNSVADVTRRVKCCNISPLKSWSSFSVIACLGPPECDLVFVRSFCFS